MLLLVCEGDVRPEGTLGAVVSVGGVPFTVTVAVAEVAVAPWLSVATARKPWVPAVAPLQVTL